MTLPALRQLAIAVALVTVIARPTSGFSIERTTADATAQPLDLVTESSLLVKSEKLANDIPNTEFKTTEDSLADVAIKLLPKNTTVYSKTTTADNINVSVTTTTIVDEKNLLTTAEPLLGDGSISPVVLRLEESLEMNKETDTKKNETNTISPRESETHTTISGIKIETDVYVTSDKPHTEINTVTIGPMDILNDEINLSNDVDQHSEKTPDEITTITDALNFQTTDYTSLNTEKLNTVNEESLSTTETMTTWQRELNDQVPNDNQPSTVRDTSVTLTETIPTSELIENTQSDTLGIEFSKRAGFLDFSKRTTATAEVTESGKSYTDIFDTEHGDKDQKDTSEGMKNLDINSYESQKGQAEQTTTEVIPNEYMEMNSVSNESKTDKTTTDRTETKSPKVLDVLSVQPINQDRKSALYTVGPNYKPMKRLEVQAAKQFVRDPDDNSWRNESISSLGIVFKPKNSSSKSFKEVLKTKNEMELNNVQERDSKEITPELRTRLEKITEVRKRKKKIDKFGETVYTDYEEGESSEGVGAPNADVVSPPSLPMETVADTSEASPSPEAEHPAPTITTESYWKKQLETISKDDIMKELGVDKATTRKPFNIAEYYDTTDDYDAEYITMPNIDLKKFTDTFRSSKAQLVTSTRLPERRPTVQYFPPTSRAPQTVVMNEYDDNFGDRIKGYAETSTRSRPTTPRPAPTTTAAPTTTSPRMTVHVDLSPPRGSFVVRHLGDFLSRAAAQEEDAQAPDFPAFTQHPAMYRDSLDPEYEYESPYHKEVVSHFVDSFNHQSERFREDFPVMFNASVVRTAAGPARLGASGREGVRERGREGCAPPGCAGGGASVELSPAYELHYYVPEQEEAEAPDGGRTLGAPPSPAKKPYVVRF